MAMKMMKIAVAEYENMKAEIERLKEQLKEGDINKDIHFDCYNERAFWKNFTECFQSFPCTLITFNVNVEKVNEKYGKATGTKVISDIVKQLQAKGVDVYHIQGEKFNIFYKEWESEKMKSLWDLSLDGDYEVSIYIGEIKSIDCKGVSAEKLKDIAVNMMYRDKKIKRPKNKNILRMEAENKRLEKMIQENEHLASQEEETARKIMEAKRKSIAVQNKKDVDGVAYLAEISRKHREEQREERYLKRCEEQGIIPHTEAYTDDNLERPLDTMWFSKSEYRYEVDGNAYRTNFWVFPISFVGTDKSLDIVIGYENNGTIEIAKGNFLQCGFNTIKVAVSARIDREGKLITNISFPKRANIVSHKVNTYGGNYMPDVFGKKYGGMQIFPLRNGISGYCESIVLKDDNIKLTNGVFAQDGKTVCINLTDEKVYIEEENL